MNNDELRNLYANLLSKSMNSDTKDSVHPSFVEIIKQLSPLDAQVFYHICNNSINPVINLNLKTIPNGGLNYLRNNITLINVAPVESVSISINNLERLKLINIPYGSYYTNDQLYNPFYNLEIYKSYKQLYSEPSKYELYVEKRFIETTDIGKSFYDICVKNN